ncbi:MAG: GWxTD domain-containing protein [Acidobacteria bacterium]|nr:GWxTD domain-containing protein [Acidobacteriota bacterium]
MKRKDLISVFTVAVLAAAMALPAPGQQKKQPKQDNGPRETVAKPLTEKERKRQEAKLKKELETPYRKWLNEDVVYIITDEERKAFKNMSADEEREQFIEGFWLRRDPSPDTQENEYKEEHYRRIAFANERYASGIPGWKTDRGMIYITFGPPDEIESHPSGGTYERPWEEGGGTTSTYPFEKWRYRYLQGVGTQQDIMIEFVDKTMTGEFRMTMDPSEKDALLMVPGAGLTMMEQMGMADKADRFNRTDGTRLGTGTQPLPSRMNQFDRLQQYADLQKAPQIKFKDLEAQVNSRIIFNLLPMQVRADYFPATASTVLTNITLQFNRKDMQFKNEQGLSKAVVNIYARITSQARRVVSVFEEVASVDVASELLQEASKGASIYQKSIPLAPGMYRLNVVAKDVIGGNMNNYEMALNVPRMDEEKLFASSLILADLLEKVPTKSIGMGQFVIGSSKVRPRLGDSFRRNEKMGIYLKLYNFQPEEKTNKPSGTVEYEIIKTSDNSKVIEFSEDVAAIDGASASQVTIEKLLPLSTMEPGQYTLKLKVTDKLKNQTLTQSAQFSIT